MRYVSKILSIKEKGDSSQINQAYNNHVSKSDKKFYSSALSWICNINIINSNIINQRDLVHTGIVSIQHTN